jgi:excisionase family DNA binding protein
MEQLLKEKEAAKLLNVSYAWLKIYRRKGNISYVRVGGHGIRYRKSDLEAWVNQRLIEVKGSTP